MQQQAQSDQTLIAVKVLYGMIGVNVGMIGTLLYQTLLKGIVF